MAQINSYKSETPAVDDYVLGIDVSNNNSTKKFLSGSVGRVYDLTGYGTTNGTAGVQLYGSDLTTDQVAITGAGTTLVTQSGNTITVTSADQYTGTVDGTGTAGYIALWSDSNTIGDSIVQANGSGITLAADKNLNIGTSSLSYSSIDDSLDIVTVNDLNLNGDVIALTGGVDSSVSIDSGAVSVNGSSNIIFSTGGVSERMRIVGATGYVGIGTSAPTRHLQVAGAIYASTFIEAGQYIQYPSNVNNLRTWSDSVSDILYIGEESAGLITGIAIDAPNSKINIQGVSEHADNAAALLAGLVVGDLYHTSGVLKIVI